MEQPVNVLSGITKNYEVKNTSLNFRALFSWLSRPHSASNAHTLFSFVESTQLVLSAGGDDGQEGRAQAFDRSQATARQIF